MTKDTRSGALAAAIETVERAFGKGALMRLGDRAVQPVAAISSGCPSLDLALGVGGLPRGRIIEVFGPEASGKTTLALQTLAQVQAQGGQCAFVDAEHALDPGYAAKLGVRSEELLISQPDHGEQALEIVDILTRSGAVQLVVVDSVAALVPKAELEGEMGDSHVGLQARLMSQALRKITATAARSGTMVLFINQTRQKIGVTFGSGLVTTGGNALKFYASVRMEIRRIGAIKQGEEVIGNRTKIKVVKNKVAPPFQTAEVDIYYGEGISAEADLLDLGLKHKQLVKSGSWFRAGEERLGHGREAARKALAERPELCGAIRAEAFRRKGIADGTAAAELVAERRAS